MEAYPLTIITFLVQIDTLRLFCLTKLISWESFTFIANYDVAADDDEV